MITLVYGASEEQSLEQAFHASFRKCIHFLSFSQRNITLGYSCMAAIPFPVGQQAKKFYS